MFSAKQNLPLIIALFFFILSLLADCAYSKDQETFTPNRIIYACKPNKTECGFRPAKLIFLQCREQIFIDHMGAAHKHIYCSQPRYLKPHNVG